MRLTDPMRAVLKRAADEAVYWGIYRAHGLKAAVQYRLWMAVVNGGFDVRDMAKRLGRRPSTLWRWLLDAESDLPLRGIAEICLAVDADIKWEMRPAGRRALEQEG